jgi:hypothetical protein
MTDH